MSSTVFRLKSGDKFITPFNKIIYDYDYFGWSNHGVTVPRDMIMTSAAVWNRFDMSSGATVVDVQGLVRVAEEKNAELSACKKELELSKEMVSLLRKLVEEKEKVDVLTNQLLALKG
ncbi:unnamed protein product [Linum trigynum]|uniref:Uncharacterized protein n=1 Tax=Linum trigynum TaxID=586398 RepID=A0AAV2FJX7_9ROSI